MNHSSKIVRYTLIWICLASMAPIPLLRAQTREETALWESIKDSKDAEDYKGYLDKYPEGTYAPVAKRRVAQLEAHPSQQTPDAQSGTKKGLTAAQAPSKSPAAVPVTMTECEGTNNCATWTFLGSQGNGHWPSGEVANLSVERYDDNTVVIRRADSTGSSAGLTAVYTGTRHDDRVGGEFTSSWPGHWDKKSSNWYATVEKDSQSLPTAMHFCQQHCFTFTLENGRYALSAGGAHNGSVPVMTIERFTRESVIIHRTDTGNFARTGVYSGRMSDDGNSLSGDGWKVTWGAALNSLPGSDEERDRAPGSPQPYPVVVSPVVVCVPWFFTVVCGR